MCTKIFIWTELICCELFISRGQAEKEFKVEVEAIGKVRHPNIATLRAYCWSVDEKLLIYDYIPNGDLATAIHGKVVSLPH